MRRLRAGRQQEVAVLEDQVQELMQALQNLRKQTVSSLIEPIQASGTLTGSDIGTPPVTTTQS